MQSEYGCSRTLSLDHDRIGSLPRSNTGDDGVEQQEIELSCNLSVMKVADTQEDQQRIRRDEAFDRCSALRNHRISFGDAVDPDAERVNTIDQHDILFGRGKGFQNRY
eukprot:scaffold4492_cov107-Cylindrotheca_fusiformis.AAC.3